MRGEHETCAVFKSSVFFSSTALLCSIRFAHFFLVDSTSSSHFSSSRCLIARVCVTRAATRAFSPSLASLGKSSAAPSAATTVRWAEAMSLAPFAASLPISSALSSSSLAEGVEMTRFESATFASRRCLQTSDMNWGCE